MDLLEAKPLRDFRDVVFATTEHFRETNRNFTPEDELRINRQIVGLINEFKSMYEKLLREPAHGYRLDEQGDTVMFSETEFDELVAAGGRKGRVGSTVVDADGEAYELLDERDSPEARERLALLDELTSAYPIVTQLAKVSTILTADQPTSRHSGQIVETPDTRLTVQLYLRNRLWTNAFVATMQSDQRQQQHQPQPQSPPAAFPIPSALSSANDLERELWKAYAEQIPSTTTTFSQPSAKSTKLDLDGSGGNTGGNTEQHRRHSNTSREMRAFDAFFEPRITYDLSPAELIVAVETWKLAEFYGGLVREQLAWLKRDLAQSQRDRDAQQQRYQMLLEERRQLGYERKELAFQLKARDEQRIAELERAIRQAHNTEIYHRQSNELKIQQAIRRVGKGGDGGGGDDGGSGQNVDGYRNFLTVEYLRREKAFLEYLAEVLERRRNNKHIRRLPNSNRFFDTAGFRDQELVKRYLQRRDAALRKLYSTAYDRESEMKQPSPPLERRREPSQPRTVDRHRRGQPARGQLATAGSR